MKRYKFRNNMFTLFIIASSFESAITLAKQFIPGGKCQGWRNCYV